MKEKAKSDRPPGIRRQVQPTPRPSATAVCSVAWRQPEPTRTVVGADLHLSVVTRSKTPPVPEAKTRIIGGHRYQNRRTNQAAFAVVGVIPVQNRPGAVSALMSAPTQRVGRRPV